MAGMRVAGTGVLQLALDAITHKMTKHKIHVDEFAGETGRDWSERE